MRTGEFLLRGKPLSESELATLRLLADGLKQWEVARVECVSTDTVASRSKNIMRKLDARNIPQAIAVAFRQGLLS